jgi:hypothetical protein
LPARRSSGPEESEEFVKMFGKKKSKSKDENSSSHYSLRMERKKKNVNNHSAEYLCKNTSSSESLDNIISSYKLKGGRKGFSLDRSYENDIKPQQQQQSKPKRSSWFLRKSSKSEKFLKRSSLDFSVQLSTAAGDVCGNDKPRTKVKTIYRQNAADYTGDSSTTPQEELPPEPQKKLSKFQIGKRFLKGEIGIRSFNYYLIKEGLKKGTSVGGSSKQTSKEKQPFMSKSEENIYEEIYFRHDQPTPKPQMPPALPPLNNSSSSSTTTTKKVQSDDGGCFNCEICLQEAAVVEAQQTKNCDKCLESHQHSLSGSDVYAKVTRKLDNATIYDFFQQQGQPMLQFQSYNPNNPSIYKIETTPVAFEYNPIELQQLYARVKQQQQQNYSGDGKIISNDINVGMTKSLSSNDSIKSQQRKMQESNEFYTRPNYFYPPTSTSSNELHQQQQNRDINRTDSSNSLRSMQSNHIVTRDEMQTMRQLQQDMSDSSLGDSLFSSDANKRYFGSSESCRFNYESGNRRRCSLENEKCSFSDTCRYECNLRNCDCSSSYFSSDFDDNIYNNNSKKQAVTDNAYTDPKIQYAEDFIKHVNNVKRRFDGTNTLTVMSNTTSIYEVPKANPKRLDMDDIAMMKEPTGTKNNQSLNRSPHNAKATGTVPKSSISSNDSKKSSTRSSLKNNKPQQQLQPQNRKDVAHENDGIQKVTPGNEQNLLVATLEAIKSSEAKTEGEKKCEHPRIAINDDNNIEDDEVFIVKENKEKVIDGDESQKKVHNVSITIVKFLIIFCFLKLVIKKMP